MTWPRDEAKLERVRRFMEEEDLDALVVRAPDHVLYLSNYWGMKGYDAVVFPREGEPTLIALEPQRDEAERTAWTSELRLLKGYDENDARPPTARTLELARDAARPYERIGLELSLGTQAADRMVGEPTTYTRAWFDAWPDAVDATRLLARARAVKTAQEVERMRLANEIAAAAMVHCREHVRPGMKESEAGALWNGFVHAHGTGWEGKVELAHGFSLVWSGPGIRTFTSTGARPVQANEPTLFEIWVCADGYWCDHTKNVCPGDLTAAYERLLDQLLEVYAAAVDHCRPGASLAELDRLIRRAIAEAGYPGQPSHPIAHGVGARAHEPPYAHQATGGTILEGMVLAIEPGIYWDGGGGLRLEDNFLVTADGPERLGSYPDDFREK
jgi:Xaa-Pro aminopeptidase